ncbi:MAG: hypothetical protein ABI548_27560 [Polyangiaceae bacterium]
MDHPVKSTAFSRMVSRLVHESALRTQARSARRNLLFILAWSVVLSLTALSACSKSECLRSDCQTSIASDGAGSAGRTSTAPASSTACSANAQCDENTGEFCVQGTCRLSCQTHFDCQGFGECEPNTDADGGNGHYCDLSHPQRPGQFYTRCPNGDSDCDAANGFLCIGAGSGDLEAYCTVACTTDATCADGYACTPLVRSPCTDECGVTGVPKDRQCVTSDQIGDGKPYQCGSRGPTRNVCRPRKFCNTCSTDADCFGTANQVCAADASGAKICTQLCDTAHPSCPWGNAAECAVTDQALNVATCSHRFGSCTGTGKSCEPCLKDADCGSNGACTASEFTGEHWCVNFADTCSCGKDADSSGTCTGHGCPKTPKGLLEMSCVDNSTSGSKGVCVGANTATGLGASSQTGCWPAK